MKEEIKKGSKKINGMSVPAEATADIGRLFDLMKKDRES